MTREQLRDDRAALGTDKLVSREATVHIIEDAASWTFGDFLVLTVKYFQKLLVRQVVLPKQNLSDQRSEVVSRLLLFAETFIQLVRGNVVQPERDLPE
jgi:hypothetical protein